MGMRKLNRRTKTTYTTIAHYDLYEEFAMLSNIESKRITTAIGCFTFNRRISIQWLHT